MNQCDRRRAAVGPAVPMVVESGGHCGHAPMCLNVGTMDDRDPMGCCRCGDRFRELFTPFVAETMQQVVDRAVCPSCHRRTRALLASERGIGGTYHMPAAVSTWRDCRDSFHDALERLT